MKNLRISLIFLFCCLGSKHNLIAQEWTAKWISKMECQSATNTWLAFRKVTQLHDVPKKVIAKIAVDSKYWLWINGKLVVFEGGLKRGPNPLDTYYDEVDISNFLKLGDNTISLLVWYFGKDGFSHKSSGKAGLIFDCTVGSMKIISDKTWKSIVLSSFQTASKPAPNFRLSESSILYDAREDIGLWWMPGYSDSLMGGVMELGAAGSYPWNKLVKRPIPLWKNYGLKDYNTKFEFPFISTGDTIVCELPYNAQITPYLKIETDAGKKIEICTDNYLYYNAGDIGIKAEYISKDGLQEYESLGWINGHKVYYFIPKGVKILDLKFRETGYHTEFAGSFKSSNPFLDKYWEKSVRSLYLNMRDTYMDCPDRERAQWSGDQTNESGISYYAFDTSCHALARKYLYETINWKKGDGGLFGPVPAGNWDKELPEQILSSIGIYGIWNYYLNTADTQVLKNTYSAIKEYLLLWEADGKGTIKVRSGGWNWGDWGKEKDMRLLYNLWYYLAIKSFFNTSLLLGRKEDAVYFKEKLGVFKTSFNTQFWTGKEYRSPEYLGRTDDRVQALAVVAGIAPKDYYPFIMDVFKREEHSSPFMEKFVLEAMLKMGYIDEGIQRFENRFGFMVNYPGLTTLFEGWDIGKAGYGGGSINHAWGGAGVIPLVQYISGLTIEQPGYKVFRIVPNPGSIKRVAISVPTKYGMIYSGFENQLDLFTLSIVVPGGTSAVLGVPPDRRWKKISINGKLVWKNGKHIHNPFVSLVKESDEQQIKFSIQQGNWKLTATK
ncbi:MAG: alpha-L-rhamnosidase C-terminal domain-containing protein [Niabella sp.]